MLGYIIKYSYYFSHGYIRQKIVSEAEEVFFLKDYMNFFFFWIMKNKDTLMNCAQLNQQFL